LPYIEAPDPDAVFPAKAGTQIHPERLVGFTWAPTFVGETGILDARFNPHTRAGQPWLHAKDDD
jgi:hypothetical protein